MIRRIVLKNYMSHAETVIEPVFEVPPDSLSVYPQEAGDSPPEDMVPGGLTVIIGENNSGKSAIVSAIQTVCQNAGGGFMVRHGEKSCSVTIETTDGFELTWRRERNKTGYVVNSREVDRLNGSIPRDLHDFLKMPLVSTSRDQVDVHLGEQKKPIFLLADKSADRAAFFAASSDSHKLIQMQSLHRNKVASAKREFRRISDTCDRLAQRKKCFQPLAQLEKRTDELQSRYLAIRDQAARAQQLGKLIESIRTGKSVVRRSQDRLGCLASLKQPPTVDSTNSLSQLIKRLQQARARASYLTSQSACLDRTRPFPEISDVSRPMDLVARLAAARAAAAKARSRLDALARLESPPEDQATEARALKECLTRLGQTKQTAEQHKKSLIQFGIEHEEAEQAIRQMCDGRRVCPTCLQPLAADSILDASDLDSAAQ